MSYETGAGDDIGELLEQQNDEDEEAAENVSDETTTAEESDSTEEPIATESETTHSLEANETTAEDDSDTVTATDSEVVGMLGLDVTQQYTSAEVANAVIPSDYHDEQPQVPYAFWREGVSHGRKRKTFEVREGIDELVEQVQREFKHKHGVSPSKTDLRELALVCGLLHYDEIVDMGEEWGLQYDN